MFGGGGITPDIYVEINLDFNKSTRNIIAHPDRLTFKFAGEIKNEILDQYDDFDNFTNSYHFNGKKKRDFFNWLETQNVAFEIEEVEKHWNYIQNRILANVASSIWGKEFLFKKLLEEDNQAQEALKHFDEARELIGL